jgi:hypothetical protein
VLESFTISRGRRGVAQIAVDDDDLGVGPPEGDGAVAQRVLTLGALCCCLSRYSADGFSRSFLTA